MIRQCQYVPPTGVANALTVLWCVAVYCAVAGPVVALVGSFLGLTVFLSGLGHCLVSVLCFYLSRWLRYRSPIAHVMALVLLGGLAIITSAILLNVVSAGEWPAAIFPFASFLLAFFACCELARPSSVMWSFRKERCQ